MRPTPSNIALAGIACFTLLAATCVGRPHYRVWEQGMAGKAKLAEAEQSRKIRIEEAKAAEQSATLLALAKLAQAKGDAAAELERARGMAEAIEIIGSKLQDNPAYLRYRWVEGLHDGSSEIIYIPTEAGMPILEATRRAKPTK